MMMLSPMPNVLSSGHIPILLLQTVELICCGMFLYLHLVLTKSSPLAITKAEYVAVRSI